MPQSPDSARPPAPLSRVPFLSVVALIAAGFGLTLLVFYPGIMTYDARFVHEYIAKGIMEDWQSPVMILLWGWIDPIAPGPASMFLLIVTLYWLAVALLALTLARRSVWLAVVLVLLALVAAGLCFPGHHLARHSVRECLAVGGRAALSPPPIAARSCACRRKRWRWACSRSAFCCVRTHSPPRRSSPQRSCGRGNFPGSARSYGSVPIGVALFGLVQFVYYGVLHATRQHPLHSIMVFDLGGISHFAKENQFPVTFSAPETALLINGCYQPTLWDIYWRLEPCEFVMKKLQGEKKIFGTPALTRAWASAVFHHPVAYLEHRADFMWNFLGRENLTTVDRRRLRSAQESVSRSSRLQRAGGGPRRA